MSGQAGNKDCPQEGGYVYVIHALGTSRVKIGYSADPEKRLRELQTGSPFELRLLAKWPGSLDSELSAHRAFADHRCVGEWFEVDVQGIVPLVEASLHLDLPNADGKLSSLLRTLRHIRDIGGDVKLFNSPNGVIIQLTNVAICQTHKQIHTGEICPHC